MTTKHIVISLVAITMLLVILAGCSSSGTPTPPPVAPKKGSLTFTYNWPTIAPFGDTTANSATVVIGNRQGFLLRPSTSLFFDDIVEGDQSFTLCIYANPQATGSPLTEARGTIKVKGEQSVTYNLNGEGVAAIPRAIIIAPVSAVVTLGQTQSFSAAITGSSDTRVNWAVQESYGGSITDSGLYTAPQSAGIYHIIVTSVADHTVSMTISVTVVATSGELTVE